MDVKDFVQRPEAAHTAPVTSNSHANNSDGSLATTAFENSSNGDTSQPPTNEEKKEQYTYLAEERSASDSSASFTPGDEKALEHVETRLTTYDQANDGRLFHDGTLVRQPAPSMDPRDPLNLSLTRKLVAAFFLCFYGALAASAELILGAMLPVFALQYAGIDPKYIETLTTELHGLPKGSDPLKTLEDLPNAPPIWHVYLLVSETCLFTIGFETTDVRLGIAAGLDDGSGQFDPDSYGHFYRTPSRYPCFRYHRHWRSTLGWP